MPLSFAHPARRFAAAIVAAGVLATAAAAPAEAAAERRAALVVDAATGKTLYAKNADDRRFPASLTKMMTLYILFEEMQRGRISNETRFEVSAYASKQAPSKLGLRPGQTITALEAIRALVTKSANDAAMVVAENIGGSEAAFARRMTETARRIGMTNTVFRNPHGLPNPGQHTTARDLATLGLALQKRFPALYRHFSTASFTFRGRTHRNHNKLLGRVQGVDGIKTGYIRASGFNLVTSVKRDGRQIVAVVLGGASGASRDKEMAGLVEKYLPQATKTSGALVASAGPAPLTEAAIVAAAAKMPPMPPAAPRALPEPVEVAEATAEPMSLATAYASTGTGARPQTLDAAAAEIEADAQGDAEAGDGSDDVAATASISRATREGWTIQIAAMPDRDAAVAYLSEARGRFTSLLSAREPYTEPVKKGGTTLYRARFAGFDSQAQARAACSQLAKRDYACLAVRQ